MLTGVDAVCPTTLVRDGRRLFRRVDGKLVPVRRIYNRIVFDELEQKRIALPFRYTDDLDVTWCSHPNWYWTWSKYTLPYIDHPAVPRARYVSDLDADPGRPRPLRAEAPLLVRRRRGEGGPDARGHRRASPRRTGASGWSCRRRSPTSRRCAMPDGQRREGRGADDVPARARRGAADAGAEPGAALAGRRCSGSTRTRI